MRRRWIWAVTFGAAGVVLCSGGAVATTSSGITNPPWSPVVGRFAEGIDTQARTDVDPGNATDFWQVRISAKGATDVHVIENIVAPGGTFGWHGHPGPSLIIVKSGMLTEYHAPDCTPHDYGPGSPLGSTFVDDGNDVHLVRNNGAVTVDSYVVSFLPAGFARRIDKPNPDPSACPS